MSRTTAPRRATLAATAAALVAGIVATGPAAHAAYEDATMELPRATSKYPGTGPFRPYVQEIMIGGVVPLKDEALLNRTRQGYLYRAGQQNSDITITQVDGRVTFVDKGTRSWKWMAPACTRIDVPQGVGASCIVAPRFTEAKPMLVEVWPRLGDDTLDTTALPTLFDISFLGDRGDDTARLGPGNDFVNAAQDDDHAYGGEGDEWIRGGTENDVLDGQDGDDYILGLFGNDTLYGGTGNDSVYGADGDDTLFTGEGIDRAICGGGADEATFKTTDRAIDCERTNRS